LNNYQQAAPGLEPVARIENSRVNQHQQTQTRGCYSARWQVGFLRALNHLRGCGAAGVRGELQFICGQW
jgi:hypothetical protein